MHLHEVEQYKQNHNISEFWSIGFITGYVVLFFIVMPCNLIAMIAGYRRYTKCKIEQGSTRNRTELTRCILIIYLSILDILLCLTIPFTAIDQLTIDVLFANPNIDWMCRYTKFLPAMVIYATSMLVVLIAVDSYRNICQPLKNQLTPTVSGYLFIAIIIVAIILALPLFHASQMIFIPIPKSSDIKRYHGHTIPNDYNGTSYDTNDYYSTSEFPDESLWNDSFYVRDPLGDSFVDTEKITEKSNEMTNNHVNDISICVENWELIPGTFLGNGQGDGRSGRLYYSIFSLIAQYIFPFVTISILHAMVYLELKTQGKRRSVIIIQIEGTDTSHSDNARMKRNTTVLTTMALVFCFCWLPQNLIYVALEGYHKLFGYDPSVSTKVSVMCHWIGMSSTWINPIIYGYLNPTIRQGMSKFAYVLHSLVKSAGADYINAIL